MSSFTLEYIQNWRSNASQVEFTKLVLCIKPHLMDREVNTFGKEERERMSQLLFAQGLRLHNKSSA